MFLIESSRKDFSQPIEDSQPPYVLHYSHHFTPCRAAEPRFGQYQAYSIVCQLEPDERYDIPLHHTVQYREEGVDDFEGDGYDYEGWSEQEQYAFDGRDDDGNSYPPTGDEFDDLDERADDDDDWHSYPDDWDPELHERPEDDEGRDHTNDDDWQEVQSYEEWRDRAGYGDDDADDGFSYDTDDRVRILELDWDEQVAKNEAWDEQGAKNL
jgi:hypothetical protein